LVLGLGPLAFEHYDKNRIYSLSSIDAKTKDPRPKAENHGPLTTDHGQLTTNN